MSKTLAFTVVYETVEQGWTQARIVELPAVITAAPTLEEAKELILDALREYLLSLAEPAAALPREEEAKRSSLDIILQAS